MIPGSIPFIFLRIGNIIEMALVTFTKDDLSVPLGIRKLEKGCCLHGPHVLRGVVSVKFTPIGVVSNPLPFIWTLIHQRGKEKKRKERTRGEEEDREEETDNKIT